MSELMPAQLPQRLSYAINQSASGMTPEAGTVTMMPISAV